MKILTKLAVFESHVLKRILGVSEMTCGVKANVHVKYIGLEAVVVAWLPHQAHGNGYVRM